MAPLPNVPNERFLIEQICPLASECESCEQEKRERTFISNDDKKCKRHIKERKIQNINPYLLTLRFIVYNDSLKHEDPNESLERPKHRAFKLPQAL